MPMIDIALIQQTEQSLAALKTFASKSNNEQLLAHVQRLEATLYKLAKSEGSITVGDISGSSAVAIGHDINIIINQTLRPAGGAVKRINILCINRFDQSFANCAP